MIRKIRPHVGLVEKFHRLEEISHGAAGKIAQGFFGVESRTDRVHRWKMLVDEAGGFDKTRVFFEAGAVLILRELVREASVIKALMNTIHRGAKI